MLCAGLSSPQPSAETLRIITLEHELQTARSQLAVAHTLLAKGTTASAASAAAPSSSAEDAAHTNAAAGSADAAASANLVGELQTQLLTLTAQLDAAKELLAEAQARVEVAKSDAEHKEHALHSARESLEQSELYVCCGEGGKGEGSGGLPAWRGVAWRVGACVA